MHVYVKRWEKEQETPEWGWVHNPLQVLTYKNIVTSNYPSGGIIPN